jgi:hypothetical protein
MLPTTVELLRDILRYWLIMSRKAPEINIYCLTNILQCLCFGFAFTVATL